MTTTPSVQVTHAIISPVHSDERGSIYDLVEEQVGHVGLITFTAGSTRGNHYHKISVQYSYILKGELDLITADQDGSNKQTVRITAGTLSRIPPGIVHTYKAVSDAEMLDIVTLSRSADGYESDTVRVQIA